MRFIHLPSCSAPVAVALACLALPLAACGDDEPGAVAAADTAEPAATTDHDSDHDHDQAPRVRVGMRDYAFDEVPEHIAAGTAIDVTNASTTELHELVAIRLPEGEDRTVDELITLDPAEFGALLASEPAAVLIAPPGRDGIAVVGDGTLTEPGRYLLLSAIPIGADPDEYLAAAQSGDGPPQVDGGPPHFTAGMVTDIEVRP